MKFLADENFNGIIVRGLLRREPTLDIVRAQDEGLTGMKDGPLLEWAAQNNRILLTHDIATVPPEVNSRVERGVSMPGVIAVVSGTAFGTAIEDILLVAQAAQEGELEGQVFYVPI